MAKKDANGGDKKKAAAPAQEEEKFKFTIKDLADKLDVEPAAARVRLRAAGVKKAGKGYGWDTDREFADVVKKCAPAPAKKEEARPSK